MVSVEIDEDYLIDLIEDVYNENADLLGNNIENHIVEITISRKRCKEESLYDETPWQIIREYIKTTCISVLEEGTSNPSDGISDFILEMISKDKEHIDWEHFLRWYCSCIYYNEDMNALN